MVKVRKKLLDKKMVKAKRVEFQTALLQSVQNVLGSEVVIKNANDWVKQAKEALKKKKNTENEKQLEVEQQNLKEVTKNYENYLSNVEYFQARIQDMDTILKGGDFNVEKWQIWR